MPDFMSKINDALLGVTRKFFKQYLVQMCLYCLTLTKATANGGNLPIPGVVFAKSHFK